MSVTVSTTLIWHVRKLYDDSLNYLVSQRGVRYGINGYTDHAIPAYVMAVAAVEAFINESFLSDVTRMFYKESPLWKLQTDWLEKLDLNIKLVLVPYLLFGQSFARDQQPYQDMSLLIRVRNLFVHYKMTSTPPAFLQTLDDRRISLVAPRAPDHADFFWAHKLSSTEGIRWANNTACDIVHGLVDFIPRDKAHPTASHMVKNFTVIKESYTRDWLTNKGIDPDSNHPPNSEEVSKKVKHKPKKE